MKDKYIYNLFKITTNILFVGHRRRQGGGEDNGDRRQRRSRFINKIKKVYVFYFINYSIFFKLKIIYIISQFCFSAFVCSKLENFFSEMDKNKCPK